MVWMVSYAIRCEFPAELLIAILFFDFGVVGCLPAFGCGGAVGSLLWGLWILCVGCGMLYRSNFRDFPVALDFRDGVGLI